MARTACILLLLLLSASGRADTFTPSHDCYTPVRPYEFSDEWQLHHFKAQVEQYRTCIEDFVEDQRREIRNHENGIEEAIDEWNAYVESDFRF